MDRDAAGVAVVFGTRPEIVKLAGLIRLLGERVRTVHTGQHYSHTLAGAFLADFGIGAPDVALDVGGRTRGEQIGAAVSGLSACWQTRRPGAVVVQGDTNSTLAAALAANALELPLIHLEAGLRSRDRTMPEEHNRVLVDHLADRCLAPTDVAVANLAAEGITGDRVVLTGNTVVEATRDRLPPPSERQRLLVDYRLERDGYVLATFHRPENVDGPMLATILTELARLPVPVLLPLHPRTRRRAENAGLVHLLGPLRVVDPLPYGRFLALAAEAALLVSDSGGLQEETSVLGRPMLVVRRSTERPEVLGSFADLVPAGPGIADAARRLLVDLPQRLARLARLPTPYGDGRASARAVQVIERVLAAGG